MMRFVSTRVLLFDCGSPPVCVGGGGVCLCMCVPSTYVSVCVYIRVLKLKLLVNLNYICTYVGKLQW